jgi:hypothetical protein
MHYAVYNNIINQTTIDEILELYHNSKDIRETTMSMDKLNKPWTFDAIRQLEPILKQYIDTSSNIGDNVYMHSYPYFPHVDISDDYPCVNVVIPLYIHENKEQKFIVFDQYVTTNAPRTWLGDFSVKNDFNKNKKSTFVYKETDIAGLTNNPIDQKFYDRYLDISHFTPNLFFGMSGTALEYKPGNLIIFDSKHVHCTGKMETDYKIGITLRFKGSLR